jgi:Kef-type K+ transport system membrane component KefB
VAIGVARMLELSALITLLLFGVFSRNFDERHELVAVDLSVIGQLFFVVLFVVAGARMQLFHLATGGVVALAYILARFAGKSLAVMSLMPFSGLRPGTAGMLCLALTPMSGMGLAMVQGTAHLYPEFLARLSAIVLSAALVLELLGPIAVQFALKHAGETREDAG